MSETEPIPPTSSVTALRIPMIKKGEYDLWSMKMRQYIAITDHILWDIITNGDQATTDPASSANGRNEKRIVAIEDSNSKALVATDNNEDIDWTKEFDAEPVTFAMMAD
ncbi:hypothetical protein Tco_1417823, partial [Tanacetum coccineum]